MPQEKDRRAHSFPLINNNKNQKNLPAVDFFKIFLIVHLRIGHACPLDTLTDPSGCYWDKLKTPCRVFFKFVARPSGRFPNCVSRKSAELCGKLELGVAHGCIVFLYKQ